MKSKYVKDAGHAIIDQTDADDIINAATTQGIYDLTPGILDKERRTMVAGKAHEASAITYGEAREGLMEAHNFLSAALIALIHTRNKKKRDASLVATAKSLAKSVFSIRTTTSKVTEDKMEKNKEEEYSKSEQIESNQERVTINGIGMLNSDKNKAMLLKTGEMDKGMTGNNSNKKESSKSKETKFKESADEMRRAGAALIARMEEVSIDLADTESEEDSHNTPDPLSNDEQGKDYKANNSDAKSNDDKLNMSDYNSDILEVSSGEFEAAHSQKYQHTENFLQALWNKAGPAVGSMKTMLKLMKTEFKGEVAGLMADSSNVPQTLIDFLIEEAGKDPHDAIAFLNQTANQLSQFDEESNAGDNEDRDTNAHPPDPGGKHSKASKTQGTLPRAPQANPAGGAAATTTTTVEGDKKGVQSLSMATGE
jgi:hypothetical protein